MAPKATMKRPAAVAVETPPSKKPTREASPSKKPIKVASPSKKPTKVDPIVEKCAMVVEVLKESTVLPDSTRDMLCNGVVDSLGVLRDQRHPFQDHAVSWVGETLTAIEATIQKVIDETEAKVDGADAEKTRRDAMQIVAQGRLDDLKETESQLKEKLASNTSALQEAEGALTEAEVAQKTGDVELDAAAARKEKLEAAQTDTYTKLKEGSVTGAAVKKLVTTLVSVGKSFGFDTSLLDSLPSAISKTPNARGTFDGIVLSQFEEAIAKRMGELNELIANGAPAKEARAAGVQAAQAVKVVAEEQVQVSVVALKEAQTAVKGGEAEVKTTKKAVGDLQPEINRAKVDHENVTARLAAFREGPLTAFIELRDRSTPPPPVEEEAVERAAAAEEAPAAKEAPAANEAPVPEEAPATVETPAAEDAAADDSMPQASPTEEKEPVA